MAPIVPGASCRQGSQDLFGGDEARARGPYDRQCPAGVFRRDVGDGEHAEIAIGERVYRVRVQELA